MNSHIGVTDLLRSTGEKTEDTAENYLKTVDEVNEGNEKKELPKSSAMVNHFYDIATDFYEYGWGDSFHFCRMQKGSTLKDDVVKLELYIAKKLALTPDDVVLDFGCGVGGPARNIAKFSKAKIIGININEYQIGRANILTDKAKLSHLCTFEKGDFSELSRESNSADKVYAIEAACHCNDKSAVYREAYRVLRPGGLFAVDEWVLVANKYDPNNPEHIQISQEIEFGNGVPKLDTDTFAVETLKKIGFEILETEDLALESEIPWYSPLEPSWTNFRASSTGRNVTHAMLVVLEKFGMSSKGSTKVHSILCTGADALVKGAKAGIFTPMYLMLARKPLSAK